MATSTASASSTATTTTASGPRLRVRRPSFHFAGIRRDWLNDSLVASHIANGVSLLFPLGERSFVRAVHDCLPRVNDPALLADAKLFFAQEGAHASAHDSHAQMLKAQGYHIDRLLHWYEQYHRLARHLPPTFRLSVTAALEHYTAIMAENLFTSDAFAISDPMMEHLMKWHAAEEIEHKAVAFDVLAAVAPSYALRMAGLTYATVSFVLWWVVATRTLIVQENLSKAEVKRQLAAARRRNPIMKRVFLRGLREYIARDFHPNQRDTYPLALAYFKTASMRG